MTILDTTITKKVPGKLFIAGEYAITEPNHYAVIAPVPRYLTVTLTPSDDNIITSSQSPISVEWVRHCGIIVPLNDNPFHIVTKTIEVTEQYITEKGLTLQNFELHITSHLDDVQTGKKFGLGSSGAVTVATIQALLTYYNIDDNPELVFKLAAITHLTLKSNGSFGDLAACAYQQLIAYTSLDKNWVLQQLQTHPLSQVVSQPWQYLAITPLQFPKGMGFLVGWSGSPASSEQLVSDITTQRQSSNYAHFLNESNRCVTQFIDGIQTQNIAKITRAIATNRQLLTELSPLIETKTLKHMLTLSSSCQSVGKTSGAGGGDCAFTLVTTIAQENHIKQLWQHHHITPLFTLGDLTTTTQINK